MPDLNRFDRKDAEGNGDSKSYNLQYEVDEELTCWLFDIKDLFMEGHNSWSCSSLLSSLVSHTVVLCWGMAQNGGRKGGSVVDITRDQSSVLDSMCLMGLPSWTRIGLGFIRLSFNRAATTRCHQVLEDFECYVLVQCSRQASKQDPISV